MQGRTKVICDRLNVDWVVAWATIQRYPITLRETVLMIMENAEPSGPKIQTEIGMIPESIAKLVLAVTSGRPRRKNHA